jgi:hypothetical protein
MFRVRLKRLPAQLVAATPGGYTSRDNAGDLALGYHQYLFACKILAMLHFIIQKRKAPYSFSFDVLCFLGI